VSVARAIFPPDRYHGFAGRPVRGVGLAASRRRKRTACRTVATSTCSSLIRRASSRSRASAQSRCSRQQFGQCGPLILHFEKRAPTPLVRRP